MVSSLQKKIEDTQQKEEAQLQESLEWAEQRARQKVHRALEYEWEVSAGPLLRPGGHLLWVVCLAWPRAPLLCCWCLR